VASQEGLFCMTLIIVHCYDFDGCNGRRGKAIANYPQELAQDAVCQSHTGHMTAVVPASPASKAEC
jgi:hypothetical protein